MEPQRTVKCPSDAYSTVHLNLSSCGMVCCMQSLKGLHWYYPETSQAIHPRAYNLSEDGDFQQFELDFKWSAAASVLRLALRDGGFRPDCVPGPENVVAALAVVKAHLGHLKYATKQRALCSVSF